MARRITLILDDDVYKRLVEESIRRYGSVKYISRVVNEILREVFKLDLEDEALRELVGLLSKPKIARVTPEDRKNSEKNCLNDLNPDSCNISFIITNQDFILI